MANSWWFNGGLADGLMENSMGIYGINRDVSRVLRRRLRYSWNIYGIFRQQDMDMYISRSIRPENCRNRWGILGEVGTADLNLIGFGLNID